MNDILFNDPKIRSIIRSEGEFENITIEDQIRKLTEENIFAVKFKQIESSYSPLSQALKDNCPATRTLEEAQQEVTRALGSGYTLKSNMGVGTVAETYLATSPNGKEVCIKMLKRGIDADKIIADKNKFIEIIKGLKEKSEAEKQYLIRNIEDLAEGILKEVDLQNEMKAAQELVKYTKTANVVKPIEVKNGVYVMEKAEGVSFKKLLEINNIENDIKMYERWIKDERNEVVKSYYGEKIEKLKKEKADINTKYGNILLSEKDINIMIDEYMKVLVEQLYKTDSKGRVLHADIHPGNIFIDVNALKNRKGKMFTLIDTGNTINLTADQAERSMKLTQYINRGDTKDIAKYFIEDADLSESGLTKAEATAKLEETLNKIFFSSDMELKTVNNTEIINLTSNIMKELNIMPGSSQLNLEKARTSAEQSFETLLTMWGNEAGNAIESSSSKVGMGVTAIRKLNQFMGKYNEYLELQKAQESRNLLQIIKSPKKFYQNLKNPNYKATNSEEYLIYHLKQRIRPKENNMFDFDLDDLI